jgi:hypothetical protein
MPKDFVWPHENYYQEIVEGDVVHWLHPLTEQGWRWRYGDGKITNNASYPSEVPWHYMRLIHDDCWFSNHLIFNVIQERVGERWVPTRCQECWKVVIYPRNLAELFALEKTMLHDPLVKRHSCKCGVEARPITPRLYGGYAYARSLKEGKEMHADFRKAIDRCPFLGPDVKTLLKRGCTEMEFEVGPSDKWKVNKKHKEIEDLVQRYIAFTPNESYQSDHHLRHVHRIWIEWACAHGDDTYLQYTGGKPIHGDYVTYGDPEPPEPKKQPAKKKAPKKETK